MKFEISDANFGASFGANFGENFGNFVSYFTTFFSETSYSRRAVLIPCVQILQLSQTRGMFLTSASVQAKPLGPLGLHK